MTGEYLQFGLWPVLCSVVLGLAAVPLFLLCYAPIPPALPPEN